MKATYVRLYALAAPLALLPLLKFRLSQIPDWFEGPEFRALLSQILSQIATGLADALIVAGINAAFGIVG